VLRQRKLHQTRCSVALWRVTIYHIKCPSPNVDESEKLIPDPHADLDQHQNLSLLESHPLTTPTVFGQHP